MRKTRSQTQAETALLSGGAKNSSRSGVVSSSTASINHQQHQMNSVSPQKRTAQAPVNLNYVDPVILKECEEMISLLRVVELQKILSFLNINFAGRKVDYQRRILGYLRTNFDLVAPKVREVYTQSIAEQQANLYGPPDPKRMYSQMQMQPNAAGMVGANAAAQMGTAQQILNPASQAGMQGGVPPGNNVVPFLHAIPTQMPIHPDVRLKKLAFYDVLGTLIKPSSLVPRNAQRIQEVPFYFTLTPQQATEIASNRDIRNSSKIEHAIQVQLRFCLLETSCDQEDCFPPNVSVKVNNKLCQLPNVIPTNRPNVEPKRPPRPVNVTSNVKLSPTVTNTITVQWCPDYTRGYCIAVYLVKKLTSAQLLQRMKQKGVKPADYTRALIKEKLTEDADCEIATTMLKVSLNCPLGKMKMSIPCRASTCSHLQCFDASLYLQMNERKPTWNCPVCDKAAVYDNLVIDGYFQEVLASNLLKSDDTEIQLHKDGSWSTHSLRNEGQIIDTPTKPVEKVEVISDDIELITTDDVKPVKAAASATANTNEQPSSTTNSETVDLTLSDSDDDLPLAKRRPVAKQNANQGQPSSTMNGNATGGGNQRGGMFMQQKNDDEIIILDSPSPPASPAPASSDKDNSVSSTTKLNAQPNQYFISDEDQRNLKQSLHFPTLTQHGPEISSQFTFPLDGSFEIPDENAFLDFISVKSECFSEYLPNEDTISDNFDLDYDEVISVQKLNISKLSSLDTISTASLTFDQLPLPFVAIHDAIEVENLCFEDTFDLIEELTNDEAVFTDVDNCNISLPLLETEANERVYYCQEKTSTLVTITNVDKNNFGDNFHNTNSNPSSLPLETTLNSWTHASENSLEDSLPAAKLLNNGASASERYNFKDNLPPIRVAQWAGINNNSDDAEPNGSDEQLHSFLYAMANGLLTDDTTGTAMEACTRISNNLDHKKNILPLQEIPNNALPCNDSFSCNNNEVTLANDEANTCSIWDNPEDTNCEANVEEIIALINDLSNEELSSSESFIDEDFMSFEEMLYNENVNAINERAAAVSDTTLQFETQNVSSAGLNCNEVTTTFETATYAENLNCNEVTSSTNVNADIVSPQSASCDYNNEILTNNAATSSPAKVTESASGHNEVTSTFESTNTLSMAGKITNSKHLEITADKEPDSEMVLSENLVLTQLPPTTSQTASKEGMQNAHATPSSSHLDIKKLTVPSSGTAKKHFCIFCKTLQTKIARHFLLKHRSAKQIKSILKLPNKHKDRLKILNQLRREGDFLHNTSNSLNTRVMIVSRQQGANTKNDGDNYACCGYCRGFFSKKSLRKHTRICGGKRNDRRRLTQYIHAEATEKLKSVIFPLLHQDAVTKIIRYDQLIIKYGNIAAEKYTHAEQYDTLRSQLRLLGRYKIAIKNLSPQLEELKQIFRPEMLKKCVKAFRHTANWNRDLKCFKTPSVAYNLYALIKKCASLQRSGMNSKQDSVLSAGCDEFLLLWHKEILLLLNKKPSRDKGGKKQESNVNNYMPQINKNDSNSRLPIESNMSAEKCNKSTFDYSDADEIPYEAQEKEEAAKEENAATNDNVMELETSRATNAANKKQAELESTDNHSHLNKSDNKKPAGGGHGTSVNDATHSDKSENQMPAGGGNIEHDISENVLAHSDKSEKNTKAGGENTEHDFAGTSHDVLTPLDRSESDQAEVENTENGVADTAAAATNEIIACNKTLSEKPDESPDQILSDLDMTNTIVPHSSKLKRHYCVFCKTLQANIARHLLTKHRSEKQIKSILKLPQKHKKRLNVLNQLRIEGDFLHNTNKSLNTGMLIVSRQQQANRKNDAKHYIPCKNCKLYLSKRSFRMHFRKCNKRSQSDETNGRAAVDKILPKPVHQKPEDLTDFNLSKALIPYSGDNRKRHFCIFCKTLQTSLSRHCLLRHRSEEQIKAILHLPKKHKDRLKVFNQLRKEGDFLHNTSKTFNTGVLIVSRRQQATSNNDADHYACCQHCKGFFSKQTLRLHMPKCGDVKKNDRSNMIASRRLIQYLHEAASEKLKTIVFPYLHDDAVTKIIRYDELIVKYGNEMAEKCVLSKRHDVVRSQLRLLGRFKVAIKMLCPELEALEQIFTPQMLKKSLKAFRQTTNWDNNLKRFKTPHVAYNLHLTIKKCGNLRRRELSKLQSEEALTNLQQFFVLWNNVITSALSKEPGKDSRKQGKKQHTQNILDDTFSEKVCDKLENKLADDGKDINSSSPEQHNSANARSETHEEEKVEKDLTEEKTAMSSKDTIELETSPDSSVEENFSDAFDDEIELAANLKINKTPDHKFVNTDSPDFNLSKVSVPSTGSKTKQHFCIFCKTLQTKLSRHFLHKHRKEEQIKAILKLPKKHKDRLKLFDQLRKEGDFLHNTAKSLNTGMLIVSRQQQAYMKHDSDHYACCKYCKGFFSKVSLRKHLDVCGGGNHKKNDRSNFVASRILTQYLHEAANAKLRMEIFPFLKLDEITKAIRYDELIIKLANHLVEKCSSAKLYQLLRYRLRLLGRFKIVIMKLCPEVKELRQVFQPHMLRDCKKAFLSTANWNSDLMWFEKPTRATCLSCLIRKCAYLQRAEFKKLQQYDLKKNLDKFLSQWQMANLVSKRANEGDDFADDEMKARDVSNSDVESHSDADDYSDNERKMKRTQKTKSRFSKIKRLRWTAEEQNAITAAFGCPIKLDRLPSLRECTEAINNHPVLKRRTPPQIKSWIDNQRNKTVVSKNAQDESEASDESSISEEITKITTTTARSRRVAAGKRKQEDIPSTGGGKIKRLRWAPEEQNAITSIFGCLKSLDRLPSLLECADAINKTPVLMNRTAPQLKSWIDNQRRYK